VYKITNIIIILFFASQSYGQVYQAYINAADKAYSSKDYRTAMSYYGDAIDLDDEVDTEVLRKYAQSAKSYHAFAKAKNAYIKLLNGDDESIKIEAQYQLADISFSLGEYEVAENYLNQFLESNNGTEEQKAAAQKSLENIKWVLANDTESLFDVEKLGDEVNTEFSEMSPVYVDDTLFYSSNNYFASNDVVKPESKIYTLVDGESDRSSSLLNSDDAHIGHYVSNLSRTSIYFTKCHYEFDAVKCKIFHMNSVGTISELPTNINAPNTHTTQPNIGIDPVTKNEVLYFVSDRSNGVGGLDIYYAPIKNGAYEGPYVLTEINTIGDDVSPFYSRVNNKLYFSTNGRKTFGGFDIYASSLNGSWSEPENLGSGLNSSFDDLYFSLNDDGEQGYFASNRISSQYIDAELEACCYDIYKADLNVTTSTIIAKIIDQETKLPINGAELYLSALPVIEEEVIYDAKRSEYQLDIRSDLDYDLKAEKPGYEIASYKLNKDSDEELIIYLASGKLTLKAHVVDEDDSNLNDYEYTITKTDEKDDNINLERKRVNDENGIKEVIAKNHDYLIMVDKDGYYPEEITLSHDQLLNGEELDIDIVLRKMTEAEKTKLTLDGYLPMPLFFDNDSPDQRTTSTETKQNYHQTYMKYIQRKDLFISENTQGLSGEKSLDAGYKIENFFATKVTAGDEFLDGFTEHLYKFLQQGSQAEIMLRGYASPRFASEYNDALTSRRVRSIENHFYHWRGGILMSYINSGQLKFTERPLGESQAPSSVSDALSDRLGSIYSVEASEERRVEILEIKSSNVTPY